MVGRSYKRICTFRELVSQVVRQRLAPAEEAERKAREHVAKCGYRTTTIDRLDGKGAVEYVVKDEV